MDTPAKTWGPFTGRQLTTVICVTIVMLLLPVAAWSASASHVVVDSGKVTLASPVAANVAQRSQFISSGGYKPLDTSGTVLVTPPAGKGLVITTMHFAWQGATTAGTYVHYFVGAPSTCANEQFPVEFGFATASGTENSLINPGFVVPPGKALCAHYTGTVSAFASAYGYIVAPGDVPTPHLSVGATPNSARP